MQIDFHHAVTYVVARLAGFDKSEAHVVACSSQYVDDAIGEGKLFFSNSAVYNFTASAHKMVDYRNFRKLANHDVWIPFHFLPGNEYDPKYKDDASEFVQRIICRKNSIVAKKMCDQVIAHKNKSDITLHSLGIASHVFVDTWAHRGFAGINHKVNTVEEIYDDSGNLSLKHMKARDSYYGRGKYAPIHKRASNFIKDNFLSQFIGDVNPVGHGPVLSYPDRPYLQWHYLDWKNDKIKRNNPDDFIDAVRHLFEFFTRYRGESKSLSLDDEKKIHGLFKEFTDEDGNIRLKKWWNKIEQGYFSFGAETCEYVEEGESSWLKDALSVESYKELEGYEKNEVLRLLRNFLPKWILPPPKKFVGLYFKKNFMGSEWKLMHDAINFHRYMILHEVLPEFEICAA